MSFSVAFSRRFLKTAKKYRLGGKRKILEVAEEATHLLSVHDSRSLFVLSKQWKDHALKGNKQGIRELHLSQDELLLYAIDNKTSTVELIDIISHEELRSQ